MLFSILFLATGFSDPRNANRFSVAPIAVIAILSLISVAYVRIFVPSLQAAAAASSAANRPRRRPERRPAPAQDGGAPAQEGGASGSPARETEAETLPSVEI